MWKYVEIRGNTWKYVEILGNMLKFIETSGLFNNLMNMAYGRF